MPDIVLSVFVGVFLILFCAFLLIWYVKSEYKKVINSPKGQMLHQRIQTDKLRIELASCNDVEQQKVLAQKIHQGRSISIGRYGRVIGYICSGRYVAQADSGDLKVLCSGCLKSFLNDKGHSSVDSIELFIMHQGRSVLDIQITDRCVSLDSSKLPFQGKVPDCEVKSGTACHLRQK